MSRATVHATDRGWRETTVYTPDDPFWRTLWIERNFAGLAFALAICAVPLSIAVTECFLAMAAAFRIRDVKQGGKAGAPPRFIWLWLAWAALEIVRWLFSPNIAAGLGEMRHLLLPAVVFFTMPALRGAAVRAKVWRAFLVTASIGSCSVIVAFLHRLALHWTEVLAAADPSPYLRSGGLLHHWMIYGTVEVVAFAGLLEFWQVFPEQRRGLIPLVAVNTLAILLSLTRMLWICCLFLFIVHLLRRRSKWILAAPVVPLALLVIAPVRARVSSSLQPDYYSNAERLQMLRVGWEMVRQNPLTGIGPGRVDQLYPRYLSAADAVPAYHGHLHNNAMQLAAQFGVPVLLAAIIFSGALLLDLQRNCRTARDRNTRFLYRASFYGMAAFLMAGLFDYTYGHSLALILVSFVALAPVERAREQRHDLLVFTDRFLGALLFAESLPILIFAAILIRLLSRRSPFVAHLRVGRNGELFWMWKLRTMWPHKTNPPAWERGWVQRIEAEPSEAEKPSRDPRVSSRFAAFCRRHSIDELPQLLHVLRGEMSIVGPRPLTRGELNRHYGRKSQKVLAVRPGLTGLWQIRGRSRLTYAERVQLDSELVADLSARVYFRVLLHTIPKVFTGENAW